MHKFRILAHNVTNNILTTMTSVTNNVPDVTSTLSINSDDKKKWELKWIAIFCIRFYQWSYYYSYWLLFVIIIQNIGETKSYFRTSHMKINELKEICIKNLIFYYFDDIIKIEDFDFDNILLDEKSYENILMYNISYKTTFHIKLLLVQNRCVFGSIK